MQHIKFCGIKNSCLQLCLIVYLFISATTSIIYGLFDGIPNIILAFALVFYGLSFLTIVVTSIHYCCVVYYYRADFDEV